jgi:hypothetical protein
MEHGCIYSDRDGDSANRQTGSGYVMFNLN